MPDTMSRRNFADNAPPAVLEWREKEARLREEAKAWARTYISNLINNDESYREYTVADMMRIVDAEISQPPAWAMMNKSDTASYNDRYHIIRNHLEVMARHKLVVCGTTVNAKGVENTTTYARPRDVLSQWSLTIEGGDLERITTELREFLTTRGNVLDGARAIVLKRKSNTPGGVNGQSDTVVRPKRRKPRVTRDDT